MSLRPGEHVSCACGQRTKFQWCDGCATYVCRADGHAHTCTNSNAPPGATGEASVKPAPTRKEEHVPMSTASPTRSATGGTP